MNGGGGRDSPDAIADDGPAVALAREGDRAAFNRLVVRHQDAVYTLCFRLTGNGEDAADAAQEAFLSAFRHLGEFRGGIFRSWVLRIAANACYDLHRQRKRRPTERLDHDEADEDQTGSAGPLDPPDAAPGPEAQALQHELSDGIQEGLLHLPEDQRLALTLCDVNGYDYQAIAAITGAELGTVKSRINRARRRLREHLLAQRELLPDAYRLSGEPQRPDAPAVPGGPRDGTQNTPT